MSHPEQLNFIAHLRERFSYTDNFFDSKKVLEVGSLDINGSIRAYFTNCDYTGIDVGAGRGVDTVCEGQLYAAADDTFDTIVSCECFEHNPFWQETFNNMHRMCKSEGLIIMSCATTGRKEHGTWGSEPECCPLTLAKGWHYYRNLEENDFREGFDLDSMFSHYEFSVDENVHDLYFIGIVK